ncbi:hypothetical protein SYNPS1DRAFT_24927 [Syncephalis pseudoplumigaleata]|uniref:Uncharacterized protein n=1 Tax=Syncephalis pseudoplumigaleata TaxID=1712513 RepID=A0A4P9YT71_9FUNG|nr:hypothetical protein SYNPS1DRAFT_24927 [Syncephalis pseudoplumigaleata]|eukprot:RKP23097.1 hypothetical protein SYNPS1DRAFT_24927 [Syncephalis pseudoplumigaleata]
MDPAKFIIVLAWSNYYLDNTLDLLEGYLIHNEELLKRARRWCELFPRHHHWEEKDYHSQLVAYLGEYPEYNCFEQCGEPMPAEQETLPVYFYSSNVNIASMLPVLLGLFLAGKRVDSAIQLVDNLGALWKYNTNALSSMNLFLLHYQPMLLLDHPRLTVKLLSMLRNYIRDWPHGASIELSVEQIVDRLIHADRYRKPEWRMKQQYREYVDPHEEMLHTIVLETNTMLWPAEVVVQASLDYLCAASTATPLSAREVGAVAQWHAALPRETYLVPLVMAIATALKQFAGDAILAPLVEAIRMRSPDLAANGRVLRVPRLLAVGIDTMGQQSAIASAPAARDIS